MKKYLSLILALMLVLILSATAFAEEGATTMAIDTPTKAEPSYVFHIPAATLLEYGYRGMQKLGTDGAIYVTDVQNAESISFSASYTDLINTKDAADTIGMHLYCRSWSTDGDDDYELFDRSTGLIDSGRPGLFNAAYSPAYYTRWLYVKVPDWSGATPGTTYQAVITFQFYTR